MADPILGAGAGLSSSMMMDPRLRPQDPLATPARAGLSGVAPMSMGFGNPQLDYLNQLRAANAAILGGASMGAQQAPPPQPTIRAYQNPATGQLAVGGEIFNKDDYDKVVRGASMLGQPTDVDAPPAPGFQPIPSVALQQYAAQIQDFGIGGAFSTGIRRGAANIVGAGGALLTGLGAEETGGALREYAQREQERLSPYQLRVFGEGEAKPFSYIAGLLGEMAPELVATAVSGGAGALAARGAATLAARKGAGAAGAAAVDRGLRKFGIWASSKKGAGAIGRAAKRIRDGEGTADDNKLMALVGGALAGSALYSQQRGAGEVYGEMLDRSTDPSFGGAQLAGILYAGLDLAPELMALKYVFGRNAPLATGLGKSLLQRGGRATGAAAGGAALEGVAEGVQELITTEAAELTGASYEEGEVFDRFIESLVAGIAVGGPVGGAINLLRGGPEPEPEAKTSFDEAGQGILPFGELPTQVAPTSAAQQLQRGPLSGFRAIPPQGEQLELMELPDTTGQGILSFGMLPTQVAPTRAAQQLQRGPLSDSRAIPPQDEQLELFTPAPAPAATYRKKDGTPYTKSNTANLARKRWASELNVTPDDLEVIQVPGGFALRLKEGVTLDANEEPSPAARPVGEESQTSQENGEQDTQGPEAAQTGATEGEGLKSGENAPADTRMKREDARKNATSIERMQLSGYWNGARQGTMRAPERLEARKALEEWAGKEGVSQASIDLASYYLEDVDKWESEQQPKTGTSGSTAANLRRPASDEQRFELARSTVVRIRAEVANAGGGSYSSKSGYNEAIKTIQNIANGRGDTAQKAKDFLAGIRAKLADFNIPDRPMDPVRVRPVVNQFKAKLAVRPDIRVFDDQLDLKQRDPKLYDELAAGYMGQANFDDLPAQGLSYGDKVVIFRSRIANEQQLTQVMAHETMGHFGLRRIIPARKVDGVMQKLYAESDVVRGLADEKKAANPSLSTSEAVEEVLADNAEILNDSLVYRLYSQFKTALNRVGIKFGDESMRYLLHQSRKYVRTGKMTGVFEMDKVTQLIRSVEDGSAIGDVTRFSMAGTGSINYTPAAAMEWLAKYSPGTADTLTNVRSWTDKLLREVSLPVFVARKNPGLYRFYRKLVDINRDRRSIQDTVTRGLKEFYKLASATDGYAPVVSAFYDANRRAVSTLRDTLQAAKDDIITLQGGEYVPNEGVLSELRKRARPTRAMIEQGYTYNKLVQKVIDGSRRAVLEAESADPNTDKARKAEVDTDLALGYEVVTEPTKVDGQKLTDAQWAALQEMWSTQEYISVQKALASMDREAARLDEVLDSIARRALIRRDMMTSDTRDFLKFLHAKHRDIRTANATLDSNGTYVQDENDVDAAAAYTEALNKALLEPENATTALDAFVSLFDQGKQAEVRTKMLGLKDKARTFDKKTDDQSRFVVQNILDNYLEEVISMKADVRSAKATIAAAYAPRKRYGKFVVRVRLKNANGEYVEVDKAFRNQFVYSHYESEADALNAADELNAASANAFVPVIEVDADGKVVRRPQNVTVEWVSETLMQGVETTQNLDLGRLTYALRRFGINVRPEVRHKFILALQNQETRRSNRLRSEDVPGYSEEINKVLNDHIEGESAVISNMRGMPVLDRLLDRGASNYLWDGDTDAVVAAERAWNAVKGSDNYDARRRALNDFNFAKYQWEQTQNRKWEDRNKPPAKDKASLNMSGEFYNRAARQMEILMQHDALGEIEFGTGAALSRIRTLAGLVQLGGSVVGAGIQMSSMLFNSVPFMAAKNSETGFGQGHGYGAVMAAMTRAVQDTQTYISGARVGADYYENIAEQLRQKRAQGGSFNERINGLRLDEAEMLAEQVANGAATPAQSQTVLRSARGQMPNSTFEKVAEAWMLPFNRFESNARRAVLLASYRLSVDSQIRAEGKTIDNVTIDDITRYQQVATKEASDAVELTLGEYSTVGRPLVFQQGLPSLAYMYKTYPTLVIQLLRNLPRKDAGVMLGMLVLTSGVRGIPFSEDIEDLVDGIARFFGFTVPSSRLAVTEVLEETVGKDGADLVMRGIGGMFAGDIGAKFSMSNLIPGTGIFVPGGNAVDAIIEVFGPAASATVDAVTTAGTVLSATGYNLGLSPIPSSYLSAVRQSPVVGLRGLGDAFAYLQAGAVVDRRGYVISKEDVELAALARVFGVYPSSASQQYEKVRMMIRTGNYQRDVSTAFRNAAVRAINNNNDSAALREIQRDISNWNRAARGTGLEISREWLKNAYGAARAAAMPAGERTLKYTPLASRERLAGII